MMIDDGPGQLSAAAAELARLGIAELAVVGVAKGACIRISPSFVNTPAQMDALAAALREISRA